MDKFEIEKLVDEKVSALAKSKNTGPIIVAVAIACIAVGYALGAFFGTPA